jgi:hypothetical protein
VKSKSSLHTLFHTVSGRIYEIIQEFELENTSGVRNRKVFFENLVQTFVHSIFGSCLQLKKLLKGFELNLQKIRVFGGEFSFPETDSFGLE